MLRQLLLLFRHPLVRYRIKDSACPAFAPRVLSYRGLREAILSLQQHPNRCPVTPENFNLRHLFYGYKPYFYRVIYRVWERRKPVDVLHIRHGAPGYSVRRNGQFGCGMAKIWMSATLGRCELSETIADGEPTFRFLGSASGATIRNDGDPLRPTTRSERAERGGRPGVKKGDFR